MSRCRMPPGPYYNRRHLRVHILTMANKYTDRSKKITKTKSAEKVEQPKIQEVRGPIGQHIGGHPQNGEDEEPFGTGKHRLMFTVICCHFLWYFFVLFSRNFRNYTNR